MKQLDESIYNELHRLAEAALSNEAAEYSLQPNLLVNDAYRRLRDQRRVPLAACPPACRMFSHDGRRGPRAGWAATVEQARGMAPP